MNLTIILLSIIYVLVMYFFMIKKINKRVGVEE